MQTTSEECDVCSGSHSTEECPELELSGTEAGVIVTTRARATLPLNFALLVNANKSTDVIAAIQLPSKYNLGTYEAVKTTRKVGGPDDFVLQISIKDCSVPIWLDIRDENKCNWLCLVPIATNIEEKNVMVLQIGLDIIYMTSRKISAGEPLKVWYAPSYAKKINKPPLPDGKTKSLLHLYDQPLPNLCVEEMGRDEGMGRGDQDNMDVLILPSHTGDNCIQEKSNAENGPDTRADDSDQDRVKYVPVERPTSDSPEKPTNKGVVRGKGIYLCTHPGCALVFPSQQRLDQHSAQHNANPEKTEPQNISMEDLKNESSEVETMDLDTLEEVQEIPETVFQDMSASSASALDLLVKPRNTFIRHSGAASEQVCRQCKQVFQSLEELATHVKEHLRQEVVPGKRGRGRPRKPTPTFNTIKREPNETKEVYSSDQNRKSTRTRNNKLFDDPDFVYGYAPKRQQSVIRNEMMKIKREIVSSSEDESHNRGEKKGVEGTQGARRKRGRPPKHSALKVNVIVIDKENTEPEDGAEVEDVHDTDQVELRLNNDQSELPESGVNPEIIPQVKGNMDSPADKGNSSDQPLKMGNMDESIERRKEDQLLEKGSRVESLRRGSRDLSIEKENVDSPLEQEPQMTVLVIDKETNNDACSEVAACDSTKQTIQTKPVVSREVHVKKDQEPPMMKANIPEITKEHTGSPHGEQTQETTIIINVDQLAVENLEAISVDDNLPYTVVEIIDADAGRPIHIKSDHGEYSRKGPKKTTGNTFIATGPVPTIVNLDEMDVISGEPLSTDIKGHLSKAKSMNDILGQGEALMDQDKKTYLCNSCGQDRPFVDMAELEDHLYTHVGVVTCTDCGIVYNESNSHQCPAKHSSKSPKEPSNLDNATDMKLPEKSSQSYDLIDGKFACKICNRMFGKGANFAMHMKLHENSVSCDKCDREFTSKEQLMKHICIDVDQHDSEVNKSSMDEGPDSYVCEFCGSGYKKRQYLIAHMATHTKEHKCEQCGIHFARKETLMRHWTKCIPDQLVKKEVFSCDYCSRVFTKELSLENHMRTVHSDCFKCNKCLKVFSSMLSMKRHKCNHSGDKTKSPFQCRFCPKTFTRTLYLKRHMAMHSGEFSCVLCQRCYCRKEELLRHMLECSATIQYESNGTIKCTVCDKIYTDVHAYRLHYQDHTHPYKCENCNKPFLRPVALNAHIKTCKPHTDNSIVCKVCNKKFYTPVLLLRHKQVHDEKKYCCMHCNKKFRRIDYLNKHICVDSDGNQVQRTQNLKKEDLIKKDPCICPTCGKSFKTVSNLNKHILLHSEKKEVCEVCGKKFHLIVGLREHMKYVHTDQYQIVCRVCGKRLKSRNSLYGHMALYHSDLDTIYACEECGKTFRQKGNLKKHMLVHSDNRSFSCKECNKRFKFPEQLRRHEIWHSTGPRFSCDICNKEFIMEFEIKKHLNTVHGGLTYICCYCKMDCHHFHSMKRHLQRRHFDVEEWQENTSEFIRGLAIQTGDVTPVPNKGGPQKRLQLQVTSQSKKLFRCGMCDHNVIFCSSTELQQHIEESHRGRRQYRCQYCNQTSWQYDEIRLHLETEHSDMSNWQENPDNFIQKLPDDGSPARSILRDLATLKEEADVEAMNAFGITTDVLDAQSLLSQTLVGPLTTTSTNIGLLDAVQQSLPHIESHVLSLPLQGTADMTDISDIAMDIGQEPLIVAEVHNYSGSMDNLQAVIIQGEDGSIETNSILSHEIAEALQSLSAQGRLGDGDQPTMITIGNGDESIQGFPVTISTDGTDHGLIILPVVSQNNEPTESMQENLLSQHLKQDESMEMDEVL